MDSHDALPELPPFPAALRGQRGALFLTLLLDPETGPETCLVLFEPDLTWRRFLADADLGLDLAAGVARLPHGAVAFFAWSLWLDEADPLAPYANDDRESPRYLTAYLGLLDPHLAATAELLATVGAQERLPVILLDSRQGQALELLAFENDYGLAELGAAFAAEVAGSPAGAFALAAEEFRQRYSLPELVGSEEEEEEETDDEGDEKESAPDPFADDAAPDPEPF
ncbi:MAG TPA: hypothetical protein PKO05_05310 [Thermoanaerobaculia bacterium]|jgi:hypothetical protein|nr:hypothetical protein [Thermoanaerobaculia bacterium]HNU82829.1 hypothetical protein [Thermoanaerobaculia bacterium]HNZ97565.1 hypothetical protein [Thermoanaerobaculia bacterium]HPA96044.1 hypothetical protein [Thermoanaerobaculia bacterium]HQN39348.1 hypothetical protein [Thermoanaerobaculia bacterium]